MRSLVALLALVMCMALGSCSTDKTTDPDPSESSVIAPPRATTDPGETTNFCIDALDDSSQTDYDLTEVSLEVTPESLDVTYTADVWNDFTTANVLEIDTYLTPSDSTRESVILELYITGTSSTPWVSTPSLARTKFPGVRVSGTAGTVNVSYPLSEIALANASLDQPFGWRVGTHYLNGHDGCPSADGPLFSARISPQ
jgi:hypothetical protein